MSASAPTITMAGLPPSERELSDSADRVFKSARMVWDDAVAYAESLRDRRRLFTTALTIVAGIGIFRLGWFRSDRDVPAIPDISLRYAIKVTATLSIGLVIPAIIYIYSERPTVRRIIRWVWIKGTPVRGIAYGVLDRRPTTRRLCRRQRACWRCKLRRLKTREPHGRAIAAFLPNAEERTRLAAAPLHLVIRSETERLIVAYSILVASNRRVRYRLAQGAICFLGSVIMLLASLVLHVWGLP
mgnify:CR=1 FL=1